MTVSTNSANTAANKSAAATHLLHVYAKLEVTHPASAIRVAWERDLV